MNNKFIFGILIAAVLSLGSAMALCLENPGCGGFCSQKGFVPGYFDDTKDGAPSLISCCTDGTCTLLCKDAAGTPSSSNDPNNPATTTQGDDVDVTFYLPWTDTTWNGQYKIGVKFNWKGNGTCGLTSGGTWFSGIWDANDNGGQGSCTVPDVIPAPNDGRVQQNQLIFGGPSPFNLTIGTGGTGSGYNTQTNETANNTVVGINSSQGSGQGTPGIAVAAIYVNYTNGSNIWMYDTSGNAVNWGSGGNRMPFAMQKGYNYYIGNSTTGNYFIKMDLINVISNVNSWDFSGGSVDRSITDGLYKVFDNSLNLPSTIKKILLIPAGTAPYAYCCPSATSLGEVSESCSGKFTTTTKVTGPDSIQYYACIGMTASGGGSGSTGAPELSDLGWILAAVLGAGSFVLIRKMKKGF